MIDFLSAVPVLDSTAAVTIEGFVRKAHRHGARVYIAGAGPSIRRVLLTHGVRPPRVRFKSTGADAMAAARERLRVPRKPWPRPSPEGPRASRNAREAAPDQRLLGLASLDLGCFFSRRTSR